MKTKTDERHGDRTREEIDRPDNLKPEKDVQKERAPKPEEERNNYLRPEERQEPKRDQL